MSGQPDQNKDLVSVLNNKLVNTDDYAANQRKIAQIRQLAASMEHSNEQAHQRYVEQELRRRVEEGERAQQMLAKLRQTPNSSSVVMLTPEAFGTALSTGAVHQGAQSEPHIIPSTARIEEISSSNSSHASQQVGGPSTIPVSSNGWIDSSSANQQTRQYSGQTHNTSIQSSSKFGGNMLGRWQTKQPQQHMQQQQPLAQLQGQSQWSQQQLSQLQLGQQHQRQQHQQMQQYQQQQQQQRYAQPQTTQYAQLSTTGPVQYSSQTHRAGPTYSGQGPSHPHVATIPIANSSTLEGALGNRTSRESSSSSHGAAPTSSVRPNAAIQNTAQRQQPNRQSIDKDAITADVMQRIGPNYISNMVATAQAKSSTTVPKPPTRENKAATASQPLPGSSGASRSGNRESLLSLEPRVKMSPAQVRSNIRHVAAQRPSDASVASVSAPTPPTIPATPANPASSHARPAESSAPPARPLVSEGASSIARQGSATAGPFPLWPPPSTQPSLVSQGATLAQPQFLAPIPFSEKPLSNPEGGIRWVPSGNEYQRAHIGDFQPDLPVSWISQRTVPAASHMSSDSDVQGLAAGPPTTPTNQQLQIGTSPRTPASANKKHLARDILRSLGGSRLLNGKRKRSEEPPSAAKRIRPLGAEQPDSDMPTEGFISSFQSNSAVSGQHSAVDALPVHLRREEEEEEIELVENMTSFRQSPISEPSGSSKPQMTSIPSSTPLELDEIIDISDDEPQNAQNEKLPAKPAVTVPIVAPAPSPFPPARLVPKEPLFLPSPSSSPRSTRSLQYNGPLTLEGDDTEIEAPWDMPSIDSPDVSMEQPLALESKKNGKRRTEVYVLIPPPPDWVKQVKQRSNNAQGGQRNRQPRPNKAKRKPWVSEDDEVEESEHEIDVIEEWDLPEREVDAKEADEQRRQAVAAEREAMSLTSSLLRKQPCKWKSCDVVMNTIDKLSQHVVQHAQNKPGPYICLWHDCVRRFSEEDKLLAHLDTHVRIPVPCPYQDCDLAYRTPKALVTHCRLEHGSDRPRPSSKPFKPTLMDMPPVPLRLPSYMVVPRDIRQTPISKERHALLGPWVLRNIFGPVNLEVKRQNAAVPLRSARGQIDREDATPQNIANDEYDFLRPKSPSSTPRIRLDDLPSAAVSKLVHGGLVFWEPEVDVKAESDPSDEPFDSPHHGDPAIVDDLDSSAQAEALTELPEFSSAPDAEADDRLAAIDQQGGLEVDAKSADDGCLVV